MPILILLFCDILLSVFHNIFVSEHLVNVVMQLIDRDQEQKHLVQRSFNHLALTMVYIIIYVAVIACYLYDCWLCRIVLICFLAGCRFT